ncbi:MAG: hypothetical protein ABIQ88_19630 [Chitinophagaceae bacterium]
MEIKMNESTHNRPEGKRLVDAPAVFIAFDEQQAKLQNEVAWKKSDHNSITVFKSGGTTTLMTAMHKDAILEDLDTEGLLLLQVLDGCIGITDDRDGARTITDKQMMAVHLGRKLEVVAEKESVVLLTIIRDVAGEIF